MEQTPDLAVLLRAAQDLYQAQQRAIEALATLKALMARHPKLHNGRGYLVAPDRSVWELTWGMGHPEVRRLETFDVPTIPDPPALSETAPWEF